MKRQQVFDELDRSIVRELQENARTPVVTIARRLGVSKATAARRLRRIRETGALHVATISNPNLLGYDLDIYFTISVEPSMLDNVADALVQLPETRFVAAGAGTFDLFATASFRSDDDLYTFLNNSLGGLEGVRQIEMAHELRIVKRIHGRLPVAD